MILVILLLVPTAVLMAVLLLILTPLTLLTLTSLLPLPLSPLILIWITKNPVTSSLHPLIRSFNSL